MLEVIGASKWESIAPAFNNLTLSNHWKNRKCFASSIHLIAKIVGNEITMASIIPVLDKYLYDYPDIQQVAIAHVVDFISILGQEKSVMIIQLLQNSVQSSDWRIRRAIAKQLSVLAASAPMYAQYIQEICIALLIDNVTKVRHAACKQMGNVIISFLKSGYVGANDLIQKLTDMVNAVNKTQRLDFIYVATSLYEVLPADEFNPYILPALQKVATDKCSEIRAVVANCFVEKISKLPNYDGPIKEIADKLAQDPDPVVKDIMANGPIKLFQKRTEQEGLVDPATKVVKFEGFIKN